MIASKFMIRCSAIVGLAGLCLAGCATPEAEVRFVPSSTVHRVEPQPTTGAEFQDAERQGYLVAATGRGEAFGVDDLPTQLQANERLHVLRVDPSTGEVVVLRLDYSTVACVSFEGVEVRRTSYHD